MALNQSVVTQLTIDASGATTASSQYVSSMDKAQAATEKLTAAIDKTQKMLDQHFQSMKHVAAANDNASGGMVELANRFNDLHDTAEKTVENLLNVINHLKLLAVAAYAISPAFRSFINKDIAIALGLIKEAMPGLSAAFATVAEYAGPVLAFFARITGPIAAAVIAWKSLNYVWEQGANLLNKYGNAQRALFANDVSSNLEKLTKFQQDSISADQVQYATELGIRLDAAKSAISDFFHTEIDVTNLALSLQWAWVKIVESIAAAVQKLNSIPPWALAVMGGAVFGAAAGSFIPGAGTAIGGLAGAIAGGLTYAASGSSSTQSAADQKEAARQQLATAMGVQNVGIKGAPLGGSFAARFSADIDALVKKPDEVKKTADAYELAVQRIKSQIDVLSLEAADAGKTSRAVQELRIEHQMTAAAMKAGEPITDEMRAKWKAYADQIADLTIKINQMKVLQEQTFKGQTMFMSPADQAAANAARQIDPTNWMAHLKDAGPQMAAFNVELAQSRDLATSFADSMTQGLMQGKNLADSLRSAFASLEGQLIQMATKNLINQIFGGITGAGAGGGGFNLLKLFGFADGGSFIVPAGNGAMALPGFAGGADFTVPGSGGPDSKVTAFRVSPGERVTVSPSGKSAPSSLTVHISLDNDLLNAKIRDQSGAVVTAAAPAIVNRAVGTVQARLPSQVMAIQHALQTRGGRP